MEGRNEKEKEMVNDEEINSFAKPFSGNLGTEFEVF